MVSGTGENASVVETVATATQRTAVDQVELTKAVRLLIQSVDDPDREGLQDTPLRVIKALKEMTTGYNEDPALILSKTFNERCDDMIVVTGIAFTSLCEHHMLPFTGTANVGYIPGKVVGLSKIARLVDCFARRLQIQERMTAQIADAISQHLEAKGVAVVINGAHACMSCRGVKKAGATMVTSAMHGIFKDNTSARSEFLALCKH